MYAVFTTGGKQYKASANDVLYIEKLDVEAGSVVTFDEVLLIGEDGNVTVGDPFVKGAKVEAKVEKNGKGKKVKIFKYKPKKGYRKRAGHRQPYTKITVTSVTK